MGKRITVTQETPTHRNVRFRDNLTKQEMTRPQLVQKIKNGDLPNYHIRKINGVDTPVSNPDNSQNNNLD
jgi:hypothetical protein